MASDSYSPTTKTLFSFLLKFIPTLFDYQIKTSLNSTISLRFNFFKFTIFTIIQIIKSQLVKLFYFDYFFYSLFGQKAFAMEEIH